MEIPLLQDIMLIFGLAVAVVFVCNRLKVPTVVGFLVTGVLAGPHGLGLVSNVDDVEALAQIGVVTLLFTIGVQFSFKDLLRIKTVAILGGSIQLMLTFIVTTLALLAGGAPFGVAAFVGMIIPQSSTIVMLRAFQDRAETESPPARSALGMAILQDLSTVPLMILAPLLAGGAAAEGLRPIPLMAKSAILIVSIVIAANWAVGKVLYQINKTRDRELFMFSVIFIALSVAWLTSAAGLSLALGAFIAGLIISESEYSHHTLSSILPFRDVFSSFFFVSVGMLLDAGYFLEQPVMIAALAAGVIALKATLAAAAVAILRFPLRTAVIAGVAMSQVGEFAFVLSRVGLKYGLLPADNYQMFLGTSILTMAATPFLIPLAPRLADGLLRLPLPGWLKGIESDFGPRRAALRDHLIVVGFGVNGRNVARAAAAAKIPHIIIELNPETVHAEKAAGQPIFFGDASQDAVLEHADVLYARVLVVAIPDPAATRRVIETAHGINPRLYIITRTRFVGEMKDLYGLGASEVIPEEFETSVEVFSRVLAAYLVPRAEIEAFTAEVRADGYRMFRSISNEATVAKSGLRIPDLQVGTFRVAEDSAAAGKSLLELDLRKKHAVTIVAVRRTTGTTSNPDGNMVLEAGDVIVAMGSADRLEALGEVFRRAVPA